METDSAISLSSSGSSSLSDVLPDLRKAEITKRRTRADSLSSALSSLPDSDASSDLSDLTESETDQPARKRQRKEYTPEPLSDSGDSEREDAPGSKQYLKAGLYSIDNKDGLADASFTISIEKISVEALSAVPLALAASIPAEQGSPNPELEEESKPRESRRASSIANQKFARNGSGLSTIHAKQKAPKKKALPASTILTDYVPNGSLLSLPINYGEHLIEQERDFKLSFDILRDYSSGCIKRQRVFERAGADKRPPKYWQIKQNLYVERNKFPAEIPAICQCKRGSGCGEECINRLMLYLCSPKLCPAGKSCTNGPLSSRDELRDRKGRPAAVPFWTGNRGFGLKTTVNIEEGEFIIEYRGEIISRDESYRRVLDEYKHRHDFYFLDYDGEEVIDAGMKGNPARFANHSCGPNCKMVRFRLADADEWQIGLFALKDIKAGAEICYDYGWVTFASLADAEEGEGALVAESDTAKAKQQRCHCGASKCSGYLGAKKKSDKPKPKGKAVKLEKRKR